MRDVRITSLPAGAPPWRRAAWIALAVILAVGAVWWLYHRATSSAPANRGAFNQAFPVVVSPVTSGNIDIVYNALGTVTPLATVTILSQISGQITQLPFTEGQMVKQGDLLAVIDPRPYELQLEQAQGTLAKDQALLKQAQTDLGRYQILLKQDSIAAQTVDDQVHLVEQYQGQIKVDQGVIDNDKLNIAYCHITSPVSGRAGLRQVDIGNYVTASSTANGIVVITEIQPITVVFALPEDNLPSIMQRLNAGATLQVTAYDRSNTKKLATGKLTAVDSQIDTATGTVKMRAQFDNQDGALFPNQFVNAQLLANTLQNTTIIPTAAVQRGAPGTFVYVAQPDNTVAMTPIKIGPTEGEKTAVTSGVAVGAKVVVDGADKLKDKAKIALRQESPAIPAQNEATEGPSNAGPGSSSPPADQDSAPTNSASPPAGAGQ